METDKSRHRQRNLVAVTLARYYIGVRFIYISLSLVAVLSSFQSNCSTELQIRGGHLTQESEIPGLIPGLATYFSFAFRGFKKGSCQLLQKYVYKVLVNRLRGPSLPRKSVVKLSDRLT